MNMDRITFESCGQIITADIGRRCSVNRTPGDICLSRQICIGLPLRASILIDVDGVIRVWDIDWCHSNRANYWHFDAGSDEYAFGRAPLWADGQAVAGHEPTPGQRQAIARLFFDHSLAEGLGGYMGAPPQRWCQWSGVAEMEQLGQPKDKPYYA